ncbi:putative ornithine-oxo-acid aminotransferase [Acaromyces ingoldii]|uniref:Putative ornithine-oxo-acid aminotransferase n=1 Tax=Acaromyces ingoldii TaxID=215250 RepID=A0A316YCG1_9BASI|nr:putative ornithine-oxo-acid aminotransferase [Acaromyces ingoldii]PWN86891.1 putative ornithine-oxo-acid aminotransferase [Acaromyces ingoldii]
MAPSVSEAGPVAPLPTKAGPESQSTARYQSIARNHIAPALGRLRDHVFTSGRGLRVETSDGRSLLDFTAGIGVTSLGHCHPAVTEAIVKQASAIVHVQCAIALSEPYTDLVEQLVGMMPSPSLDSFFFWNSGSEANEAAIKIARAHTRRNNIVVMQGAYHGRTSGAAALTRSKTSFFARSGPLMPCVFTTAFPYWHALGVPASTPEDELVRLAVHQLEQTLQQQSAPEDTAAIFIEPVLGEGGYVPAPASFMRALRGVCDRHGILLVADEVQTGFGRTGRTFAVEHSGVTPDVMVFAKGFANGMPLSGVVTRRDIMASMPAGSLGGTYSGNAVACAAALATTRYMQRHDVLANVNARSAQLFAGLRTLQSELPDVIVDVRGAGLMVALEFTQPGTNKLVQDACYDRGLVVLTTSIYPVLRFIPALVVDEAEMAEALAIIRQSVLAVVAAAI